MADERPRKLARLQRLRNSLPHVSQTALAAIFKAARDEPLPDASRRTIARARDEFVREATPYGTLHQYMNLAAEKGEPVKLEYQHPAAMLHHVCGTSAKYSALVEAAAAAMPPTVVQPWNLILYADEMLPGNQLAYTSARKVWGWYWSISELGSAALSDEAFQ